MSLRPRRPLRDVNRDVFSRSDLRVFDEIIARFGQLTFEELFNLTHDHAAYKIAWNNRGQSKRSKMDYADMIEDAEKRAALVEDIAHVAANMQ